MVANFSPNFTDGIIKRDLFEQLKKHIEKKEITLIVGPRQAGKTTLMLLLKDYLEKKGEKTLFLNLDIEADKKYFTSQNRLLEKIELELGREGFVFTDEIQRKEDAGVFLKGLYDMNLSYKFVVSGSGSVELKEKVHESLAGRKRVFELSTLTFEEFVNFKTKYKYEKRLEKFFKVEQEKAQRLLEEYLNFGGYPRTVLENNREEKEKIIAEIYQSYLEKDIAYLLGIRKTEAFRSLVRLTAGQIGRLTNYSELSATLGISVATVRDYLWYLEKTFVLNKVTPFFRNIRKEITKSPVFYFYDLGMRNYALGIFGNIEAEGNLGFLFQNFIFNALSQEQAAKIHFWRTKDGAEVDLVVDKGLEQIPVEIKYAELEKPRISRSLRSFIEKYSPKKAFVISLRMEKTVNLKTTKVQFLPYYKYKQVY